VLLRPGLASIFSQVQCKLAGASIAPVSVESERMNVRQFESEAYSQVARGGAWRDLLARFGLRSDLPTEGLETFAMAALRGDPEGMALGRLTADSQTLSPIFRRGGLPIGLVPLDQDIEIETNAETIWIPPGTLAVLPLDREWRIPLVKSARLAALSIPESLLLGRRAATLAIPAPRRCAPNGLAAVLIKAVETAVDEMDRLSEPEWRALEQSFAELVLTLIVEEESSEPGSPNSAALFNRVTQTIERRLHDPNLSAARIAGLEGISERYLQKLFEQSGETFSHYLRERRLQRTRSALAAPGDLRTPVADLAYACGFGDAANFNRLFKDRFGLPPGAFRSRHAEKPLESPGAKHRGWPVRALANPKNQQRSLVNGGTAACLKAGGMAQESISCHRLAVSSANVHWGYFSRSLRPVLEIRSGDSVEVETLTQHASDAPDLMIRGDPAAEDVFCWTKDRKAVNRRGAGPLDASIFGRGAGEGFGVHICTGPIFVKDAEPGDVIEVRIDDIVPRPSASPGYEGRYFGSTVSAWWGYHFNEFIEPPNPREQVTIYEIFPRQGCKYAEALFAYDWTPQVDPFGVVHRTYDYPGVPVDKNSTSPRSSLTGVRIPLRPHFGVIALAPREADPVDSVPPAYFGGNLDNYRLTKGSSVYLPVSVPGGLLSIGDPHAAQGDGEVAGTAIESSMTGHFTIIVHKKRDRSVDIAYPLIETPTEWVLTGFSHPNYLAEFGAKGQGEVYAKSSLDLAMKDAFRKTRRFLMEMHGLSEDEAIALMSAAVDFGVTQVVDGNWGVHATVRKSLFKTPARDPA